MHAPTEHGCWWYHRRSRTYCGEPRVDEEYCHRHRALKNRVSKTKES